MINEPAPTEVVETTIPPRAPIATVAAVRTRTDRSAAVVVAPRRAASADLAAIAATATRRAMPMPIRIRCSNPRSTSVVPSTRAPAMAAGMEPAHNQPTSGQCTAPRRRWTTAPMGLTTAAVTRSVDTATIGSMPSNSTSIGVMSAPPPMPVRPTVKPTMSPERLTSVACMGYLEGESRQVGRES